MKDILIKTKRLALRPKTIAEMAALCQAEADPDLKAAYGEMLAGMRALPGAEYWACSWDVSLSGGQNVGGIGFQGPPDEIGCVMLGYGIDEAYRGHGYATEAADAITAWALSQRGVTAVLAETEPENLISQKVLAAAGFRPDGKGIEGPRFRRGK